MEDRGIELQGGPVWSDRGLNRQHEPSLSPIRVRVRIQVGVIVRVSVMDGDCACRVTKIRITPLAKINEIS